MNLNSFFNMNLYTTCFGAFLIKDKKIIKEHIFTDKEIFEYDIDKDKIIKNFEKKFNAKHKNEFNSEFLSDKYLSFYQKANYLLTEEALRDSVNEDNYIMQATNFIEESDELLNKLSKRLRDWVSLEIPELSKLVSNNKNFAELALESKSFLEKKFKIKSIGLTLDKKHSDQYKKLAQQIIDLYDYKEDNKNYLKEIMEKYCPNVLEILGVNLTAKLMSRVGSLKNLAMSPSSKIQLLGAEKALFRHLKTGARCPKHGLIFQHPLIQNCSLRDKGHHARVLADKITIAVRVDYFKGDFIADKLLKDIDRELKR